MHRAFCTPAQEALICAPHRPARPAESLCRSEAVLVFRWGWQISGKSGDHAPLAAFFTTPDPSLRICARLHRRVLEQPRGSPAGRNDSFGSRVYLGESRGFAVGTHGGRNGGLFPGRQLFLLAGTAVGPWRPGKNPLAPPHARKTKVARALFQTSWRQGCLYRTVHRFVSAQIGRAHV